MQKRIFLINGARTAFAEYGGFFSKISAVQLGTASAKEAIKKSNVSPEMIDHTVYGFAHPSGSLDGFYGARHVALQAGVPFSSPSLNVNRICGSGVQSIVNATQMMLLDEAKITLAGGMENMTQVPHVVREARAGMRLGNVKMVDFLLEAFMDPYCGFIMGQTAENLAKKYDISREEQDEYALRSTNEALRAKKEGLFNEEIVPVEVKVKKEVVSFKEDNHMREDSSIEGLAKLSPVFYKDGTVTAGNSSGIVDGAASVVLADEESVSKYSLKPLAEIIGWAIVGVDPSIMGIGPVPAIKKILDKNDLKLNDIDLIEINEAFAAQYLACEKELELDRNKVNVNGGAISIGHPLAATGTRLTLTLALELKRRNATYGISSACIGGGQGIALLIKNCN